MARLPGRPRKILPLIISFLLILAVIVAEVSVFFKVLGIVASVLNFLQVLGGVKEGIDVLVKSGHFIRRKTREWVKGKIEAMLPKYLIQSGLSEGQATSPPIEKPICVPFSVQRVFPARS